MDDGRIDDRARPDLDAFGLQMDIHRAKVHADETLQHRRLVQRPFHAGFGQVEPLLHEVSPQHDRQTHRTTTVARNRIVRSHQRQQPRPRNDPLHLIQKQLPPTLPTVLLKLRLTRKRPLIRRCLPSTIRLSNQANDSELVQRFPSSPGMGRS